MAKKEVIEPGIRVLKKSDCPTLSGKSQLTYCLGCHDDGRLMLRLYSASGGGFFNNTWMPVVDILETLKEWDSDKPITAMVFSKITRGRSVNTGGFLVAALRSEGVLQAMEGKKRLNVLGDFDTFLAQAKALQSGKAATEKKPAAKAVPKEKPAVKAAPTPAKGKKKSA